MNSPEEELKIKKKQWQKVDDAKLRQLIQKNGTRNWSLIAEAIPGRSGKQCRERWHNHLDASIIKADWTAEEDEIIEAMQTKVGNQWAKITKMLPGRTDNAVKNRFHLKKRARVRFQNRIIRNQHTISSPEASTIYNVIPSDYHDSKVIQQVPINRSISESIQPRINYTVTQEPSMAIKYEFPPSIQHTIVNGTCLPVNSSNGDNSIQNIPNYSVNQFEYNANNDLFKLQNPMIFSNVTTAASIAPVYAQQPPPRILTYFHNDYDLDCVSLESTNELEFDINCFSHHEELRVIDNNSTPSTTYKPVENCFPSLLTTAVSELRYLTTNNAYQ